MQWKFRETLGKRRNLILESFLVIQSEKENDYSKPYFFRNPKVKFQLPRKKKRKITDGGRNAFCSVRDKTFTSFAVLLWGTGQGSFKIGGLSRAGDRRTNCPTEKQMK